MITVEQFKKFAPKAKLQTPGGYADLVAVLNKVMKKYGIDQSPRRIRYFMAQCHVESQGFTKWEENMRYTTPERLVAVFGTRMTLDKNMVSRAYAPDYLNNPEKLGNYIYALRYGNGNVASGDGYRYRARGVLGLTFRDNYAAYSKATYGDDRCVTNPDLISQYEDGIGSAGWFWDSRKLNVLSDTDSFTAQTKVINGSDQSVPERLPMLKLANSLF